jgi:hypothetical protein
MKLKSLYTWFISLRTGKRLFLGREQFVIEIAIIALLSWSDVVIFIVSHGGWKHSLSQGLLVQKYVFLLLISVHVSPSDLFIALPLLGHGHLLSSIYIDFRCVAIQHFCWCTLFAIH